MSDPAAGVHVAVDRLARAHDAPRLEGRIKACIEDFRVDEILGFEPDGVGPHAWLQVEKRDLDTLDVAGALARAAGVRPSDVGYAGLKDRRAVTTQWFSVPLRSERLPATADLDDDRIRVLASSRHARKLRRGTLRGNRFRVVVSGLPGLDHGALERAAATLRARGVPNYFGEQRFGHDTSNLAAARRLLLDGRPVRDRHRRGLALSAARSMLFNRVLDARVRGGTWDAILPGEVVALHGSRSHFRAERPDAELARRLAAFDVHPSGPLPGRGGPALEGRAGEVERDALAGCADWVEALAGAGLEHDRRALRVPVSGLEWSAGDGQVTVEFVLPRGAYATMVLREIVVPG